MKIKNNRMSLWVVNIVLILLTYGIIQALMSTGIINRYITGIIVLICINVIMATSLNLSTGFMGQLVLGHAGFMAIGAYTAALIAIALKSVGILDFIGIKWLKDFLMLFISIISGGILSALIGIIIGIPALRLRGDYLGIMTLGFAEIVRIIITNLSGLTGGAQGLTGIPKIANFTSIYFIMVICVGFIMLLARSRHGRAIISIRENEIAAEAVGISTTRYKVTGFSLSAGLAGIGGGLFALYMAFLAPMSFGFMKSVDILVIVVLGGMGSITGSVIGAIVLTILPEALRDFASYRMIVYSLLLIAVMIFRPQGLLGTRELSLEEFLPTLFGKKGKGGNR